MQKRPNVSRREEEGKLATSSSSKRDLLFYTQAELVQVKNRQMLDLLHQTDDHLFAIKHCLFYNQDSLLFIFFCFMHVMTNITTQGERKNEAAVAIKAKTRKENSKNHK